MLKETAGAFDGAWTHDWQASTNYESDALPTALCQLIGLNRVFILRTAHSVVGFICLLLYALFLNWVGLLPFYKSKRNNLAKNKLTDQYTLEICGLDFWHSFRFSTQFMLYKSEAVSYFFMTHIGISSDMSKVVWVRSPPIRPINSWNLCACYCNDLWPRLRPRLCITRLKT